MKSLASHYEIAELRDGLRILSWRDIDIRFRIVFSCLLGALFFAVFRNLVGNWSLAVAPFVAALAFASSWHSRVQLLVTKFEFVARGHFGGRGSVGTRIVSTGDVRRLEYSDMAGRSGLYVVTARNSQCVLPFLDWLATMEVIRAIEHKFPGLAERWRSNPTSPEDLRAIGLGNAK